MEMMKTKGSHSGEMEYGIHRSWCSGCEVYICWACICGSVLRMSGVNSGVVGSRKQASNCGARDISSIE